MLSASAYDEEEREPSLAPPSNEPDGEKMFEINTRQDDEGQIIVVGKSSRKRATTLINIPISQALKSRLDERVVGPLSMATAALLQWALDELERNEISIEARPQN